jgi:ABC-type multidrug transport system fused ATPase/permease subunit
LIEATQAYSAIQRIARFLDREIRTEEEWKKELSSITHPSNKQHATTNGNNNDNVDGIQTDTTITVAAPEQTNLDVALRLQDASFYIGLETNPAFVVSKFDMTIRIGEVVAVCGPVGCGKSSLVNGIISEIGATSSSIVQTFGPIFLVTQDAFILNTTLRENILFGQDMDQSLYDRVIEACCLRTDLELFGRSKDLTEIGERGITLSGGTNNKQSPIISQFPIEITICNLPFSLIRRTKTKGVPGTGCVCSIVFRA